jgi:hypothetical protein
MIPLVRLGKKEDILHTPLRYRNNGLEEMYRGTYRHSKLDSSVNEILQSLLTAAQRDPEPQVNFESFYLPFLRDLMALLRKDSPNFSTYEYKPHYQFLISSYLTFSVGLEPKKPLHWSPAPPRDPRLVRRASPALGLPAIVDSVDHSQRLRHKYFGSELIGQEESSKFLRYHLIESCKLVIELFLFVGEGWKFDRCTTEKRIFSNRHAKTF